MVVNETDIKSAILERRLRKGLGPLGPREMNNAVSEMVHYALMLDEVGRIKLLKAFERGQIDMSEFKRRAHRNEPDGAAKTSARTIHLLPMLNGLAFSR